MKVEELLSFFQRGLIPGPAESEAAFMERVKARVSLSLPEWEEIALPLQEQWGFCIDWVPIFYCPKKLLPWEGAVFSTENKGAPQIFLRKKSQEILMHEAIHAAREAFDEPVFEELLAYTTSPTLWKHYAGPLFQHMWEFPLFALAVFFMPFFPWIASAVVVFFLGRLLYRQTLFHRMKKNVSLSVLLCLTDREIREGCISAGASLRLQLIEALTKRLS